MTPKPKSCSPDLWAHFSCTPPSPSDSAYPKPYVSPHPVQLTKPASQVFSWLMKFHHNCFCQTMDFLFPHQPSSQPALHLISNQVLPVLPLKGSQNCLQLSLTVNPCPRSDPHILSALSTSMCVLKYTTSQPHCPPPLKVPAIP